MIRSSLLAFVFVGWLLAGDALAVGDPEQTVRESDEVLAEIVTIPGRQVPAQLLAQAQGVAVIPNVLKIGFIGGVRRGHGVVLVRDAEGEWGLPQFVILTGGSVGWQAGLQATDVVLVFLTKKSIEGLLTGKFTLGADAAVSAGPVGRNAAAATDGQLKAEILSYSRSRGLFAGVALDGSVIQIDQEAHVGYYGSPSNMPPGRVPQSALGLVQELASVSNPGQTLPPATLPPAGAPLQPMAPVPPRPDVLRRAPRAMPRTCTRCSIRRGGSSWQCPTRCSTPAVRRRSHRSMACSSRCKNSIAWRRIRNSWRWPSGPSFKPHAKCWQPTSRRCGALAQPQVQLPPPPAR